MPSPVKFYKRKSQEKHFTARRIVSDFPALLNEREWFWLSAPWTRFVAQPRTTVWIFSPRGFHRVVATTPVCSETDKRNGCQVPTMVLSEARGLSLFRVIREGLGSAVRLGAPRHAAPNFTVETHSRTRVSQEPDRPPLGKFPAMERTPGTLKLFVISDVGRRTTLLSSRRSTRSLQFCAPASVAPSPAGCPWPPEPRKIPATAQPWWPR